MRTQKLKHGGMKLPYTTINTDKTTIQTLPIPSVVRIPLYGEKGLIGIPLVKEGENVIEGQEIGFVGELYFHSSISGAVTKIEEKLFIDYDRKINVPTIEIVFQGKLINWKQEQEDYTSFSREQLVQLIQRKGVINLSPRPYLSLKEILAQRDVEKIIINGLDNGPYLSYLEHIITEKLTTFLDPSLHIIKTILNPKKIIFALPDRLKELEVKSETFSTQNIYLEDIYPQALEPLLLKTIHKKDIYNASDFIKEKVIILDLATIYTIYQVVVLGKPFIDRVITIDGQLVKNPGNYMVRIGTPIERVLEDCNIFDKPDKVINGNPLNGLQLTDMTLSCHKRTEGLLVISKEEIEIRKPNDCISCGLCEIYCPVGLIPSQALFLGNARELSQICILCGLCDYVCPSSIALLSMFEEHRMENEL